MMEIPSRLCPKDRLTNASGEKLTAYYDDKDHNDESIITRIETKEMSIIWY